MGRKLSAQGWDQCCGTKGRDVSEREKRTPTSQTDRRSGTNCLYRILLRSGKHAAVFFFHSHARLIRTGIQILFSFGNLSQISPRRAVENVHCLFRSVCACVYAHVKLKLIGAKKKCMYEVPIPCQKDRLGENRIAGAKREGFIEDLGHRLPRGIVLCVRVCIYVCVCVCVCVLGSVNMYVCLDSSLSACVCCHAGLCQLHNRFPD